MTRMTAGTVALALLLAAGTAAGAELSAEMNFVTPEGVGQGIGTVSIADGSDGAVFTPRAQRPAARASTAFM